MHTHDLYFLTVTVTGWKHLLLGEHRQIILKSMDFLSRNKRCEIYGFVIMPNHIHLIWKINDGFIVYNVQRDFLKFTSQQILKSLRNTDTSTYDSLIIDKKDRHRQFWQRRPLSVPLYSRKVIEQKLDYIHHNPVKGKWNLSNDYTQYVYSSARFYEENDNSYAFLTHYMSYFGH